MGLLGSKTVSGGPRGDLVRGLGGLRGGGVGHWEASRVSRNLREVSGGSQGGLMEVLGAPGALCGHPRATRWPPGGLPGASWGLLGPPWGLLGGP